MDTITLNALNESIAEWEQKYELAMAKQYCHISVGASSCPLCVKFISSCDGCPVKEAGFLRCNGTPYLDVYSILLENPNSMSEKTHNELIKLISNEITFLKSLLPKE